MLIDVIFKRTGRHRPKTTASISSDPIRKTHRRAAVGTGDVSVDRSKYQACEVPLKIRNAYMTPKEIDVWSKAKMTELPDLDPQHPLSMECQVIKLMSHCIVFGSGSITSCFDSVSTVAAHLLAVLRRRVLQHR